MRRLAKSLLFGSSQKPRSVLFGPGRGARFLIDPASKTQRILGLDEAEIAHTFHDAARKAQTFIDVGASDGYYPILALRMNTAVEVIGCEVCSARSPGSRKLPSQLPERESLFHLDRKAGRPG